MGSDRRIVLVGQREGRGDVGMGKIRSLRMDRMVDLNLGKEVKSCEKRATQREKGEEDRRRRSRSGSQLASSVFATSLAAAASSKVLDLFALWFSARSGSDSWSRSRSDLSQRYISDWDGLRF